MRQQRRPKAPKRGRSLLEPKALGGIWAADGFRIQARFIATRLADWLSDPTFEGFQPEGLEDVDASFRSGAGCRTMHAQVKTEAITPPLVRTLVAGFQGDLAAVNRRFVIAGPKQTKAIQRLAFALKRVRSSVAPNTRDASLRSTDDDLRTAFASARLGDLEDFISANVDFDFEFTSMISDDDAAASRLAGDLAKLDRYRGVPSEAVRTASNALLKQISTAESKFWHADEVFRFINEEIATYMRGPAIATGDVVLVAHQSLAPVARPPQSIGLSPELDSRRRRPLLLDALGLVHAERPDAATIQRACDQLVQPDGPLRNVLRENPFDPVVYYGFPHIPLQMLSGAVVGSQRKIHVVEHDEATGEFTWAGGASFNLLDPEITRARGTVAVLRLSISAPVRPEQCRPPDGPIGMDIHLAADRPTRFLVRTETAARLVASRVRELLDTHVAGSVFESLHVYAAVPVSVGVLVGQVLSATGLPRTYVYNFNQKHHPPYSWRICIDDARQLAPAVELLTARPPCTT